MLCTYMYPCISCYVNRQKKIENIYIYIYVFISIHLYVFISIHHKNPSTMGKSLKEMYEIVGVGVFDTTVPREQHLTLIKKAYRQKALRHHPDKGGDIDQFRLLQSAYEYLRDVVYVVGSSSIPSSSSTSRDNINVRRSDFDTTYKDVCKRDIPSWEYYEEAEAEDVPEYEFQYALSGQSMCVVSRTTIKKGELRVGKVNKQHGNYGRFTLLSHFSWDWIVPLLENFGVQRKTEKKLIDFFSYMEGTYIKGFKTLKRGHKTEVVRSLMTFLKSHKGKQKRKRVDDSQTSRAVTKKAKTSNEVTSTSNELVETSSALVNQKKDKIQFIVPEVTEENREKLKGEEVVPTGTFPELGGGIQKQLGKQRLKEMVEKFGGTYSDTFRKKTTTILLIGKNSGNYKLELAKKNDTITMSLHELKRVIDNDHNKLA